MNRLPEAFFHSDVLKVAPELVGMLMCLRQADGSVTRLRVTQTEAYRGEEDMACHARHGQTPRNAMLYHQGGISYVYLIYGLHWLFNIVTGGENEPQAVLLRAMEKPLDGPGKWTKHMGLTGAHNGLSLTGDTLWVEDDGLRPKLQTMPRVGIDYAQEPWRSMPWRWVSE